MVKTIPLQFRHNLADTVSFNCARILEHSAQGLVEVVMDFENFRAKAVPQGKGMSYTTPSFSQYIRMVRNYRTLKGS
jgi:methionyl-tRNA formyltransferase